jgi:protein-L-isoaspartate(D-aspartate) O-methyltransferase
METVALRRAYADAIVASAGARLPGLVDAFAVVPRERFLGPPPWRVLSPDAGIPPRLASEAQVALLYDDVLVAIDPARHLNNGQPSAHALWIDAAAPRAGDSVFHVGCGTGYYSAILAELVGGAGEVLAVDVDGGLVERARANLTAWPQVRVDVGDGSRPHGLHDVIYVSAGATHARPEWLTALAPGGRLVLPLTVHVPALSGEHGVGFVLWAKKTDQRWPARAVSSVGIFDCQGVRDPGAEAELRKLAAPEAFAKIHALGLAPHTHEPGCLVRLPGFCLQA